MNEDEIREQLAAFRERIQELERDMVGVPEGEFGMRKKVGILWAAYLKRRELEGRNRIAWNTLLQTALAFLQSGLLIFLLTGGKAS